MKLHERTMLVQRLGVELEGALLTHPALGELTAVELAGVLNRITGTAIKWALQAERHPDDPDKKADEADEA